MEGVNNEIKESTVLNFFIHEKLSFYRRTLFFSMVFIFFIFTVIITHDESLKTLWLFNLGLLIAIFSPIAFNIFYFIPKILCRGKYGRYVVLLFSSIVVFYVVLVLFTWIYFISSPQIELKYVSQQTFWWGGLVYSIAIVVLCAASAAFKLFQKWIKGHYVILELKNNLIQTELNLLKANISPHFLFNMLNNTEVLIRTEPTKAIRILGELSDFLRYQLYDASRNMVLLSSEISFLRNFLNLEKVRRDYFNFEIVKIGIHTQVEIQPLIFIPFVENAVKHNADSNSKAFVNIAFELSSEELIFICKNPKENNEELPNRNGGLGLSNVKQRLAILYPDRHTLTIEDEKDFYTVILKINL